MIGKVLDSAYHQTKVYISIIYTKITSNSALDFRYKKATPYRVAFYFIDYDILFHKHEINYHGL